MTGFRWLAERELDRTVELDVDDVSRIHLRGGSILRTSRAESGRRVVDILEGAIVKRRGSGAAGRAGPDGRHDTRGSDRALRRLNAS
jgi:hypothetical protein